MRLLILALLASQCFGAYAKRMLHEPATSQVVSGPHTDFVIWIDTTSNDLRVTGSGGFVTSSSGYDITVSTDATCVTKLDFERRFYDSSTGRFAAFARVPSLAQTSDVYLCFADSGVTTEQGNPTGVWASDVGGVWHKDDNAATTAVEDSTSNNSDGTAAANTDTKDVTGKIMGALTYNGSSDVVTVPNNSTLNASTGLTITAWVKRLRTGAADRIVFKNSTSGNHYVYGMQFSATNKLEILMNDDDTGVYYCAGASSVTSTTVYQHVAVTYTAGTSTAVIYLNGASDGSGTPGVNNCGGAPLWSGNITSSTGDLSMGRLRYESASYYGNLEIDEMRVYNTAKSGGWIQTQYNAGVASSFWTVSATEDVPASGRRRLMVIQ